jgi:signal transduction histidine kinase
LPPRPWHSPTFLAAFLLMTLAAAMLSIWAVRRLVRPIGTLAAAADALGRDVEAPPLSERGPREIATAAAAFNTMAARIRGFVRDRTLMLAAIGHDLRTPITRLKLRAEFLEDDELRTKMLADLDELEGMISATLAFGRESLRAEAMTPLDLAELLRTVLDETGDASPATAGQLSYDGPAHITVRGRPLALKRALANLIGNAVKYGGAARVRLHPPCDGSVLCDIEDEGPGVPDAEQERVFEPFRRLDSSRNRETGGFGLGLPIARDILRAHGGDVALANRREGGLRARVTLPA